MLRSHTNTNNDFFEVGNTTNYIQDGVDTMEALDCQHDYTFMAPPPDSIIVCETGTAFVRYCSKCGLEIDRHEK